MVNHSGLKPFTCGICNRKFGKRFMLFKHMLTHSKRNLLRCEWFDKQLSDERSLSKHVRIHTGDKHYVRDICNSRFREHVCLRNHIFNHECVPKIIFLFLNQNLGSGYSKEPLSVRVSFEHQDIC